MSDHGSINPILNNLISEMSQRVNVLPQVYDNWDQLDEETQGLKSMIIGTSLMKKPKAILKQCVIFFCKKHLVVNFASECDKALKMFDNNIVETGKNPHSFGNQESGAARLVRTAAKAFTSHGSEKAGVTSYLDSYLEEKREESFSYLQIKSVQYLVV